MSVCERERKTAKERERRVLRVKRKRVHLVAFIIREWRAAAAQRASFHVMKSSLSTLPRESSLPLTA